MKTKAIKFFIPALAIVFAIATSAFTAMDDPIGDKVEIQGYVFDDNPTQPCNEVEVDCALDGNSLCIEGTKQVYANMSGTTCSTELYRP